MGAAATKWDAIDMMKLFLTSMCCVVVSCLFVLRCAASEKADVIIVVGAGGSDEYAAMFSDWSSKIEEAAKSADRTCQLIGTGKSKTTHRDTLKQVLDSNVAADVDRDSKPLWLFLIGHGTSYRNVSKFNLQGPDFTAKELSKWIEPIKRPTVVVNCSSSSGEFVQALSGANRVVVTATKSGAEQNFARFGEYFSTAITDSATADLDHDEEVSVLEAFLSAVAKVEEFYAQDGRLVTEHALLEDNGDKLGIAANFYRGVRPVVRAKEGKEVDGKLAAKLVLVPNKNSKPLSREAEKRRSELEAEIEQLRGKKGTSSRGCLLRSTRTDSGGTGSHYERQRFASESRK